MTVFHTKKHESEHQYTIQYSWILITRSMIFVLKLMFASTLKFTMHNSHKQLSTCNFSNFTGGLFCHYFNIHGQNHYEIPICCICQSEVLLSPTCKLTMSRPQNNQSQLSVYKEQKSWRLYERMTANQWWHQVFPEGQACPAASFHKNV